MPNDDVNWTRVLDELRNAPVKAGPNANLKARIVASIDDILAFRNKGYNDIEIVEILKQNGIATTVGTLRNYIGVAKRAQKRTISQRRAKPLNHADTTETRTTVEAAANTQSNSAAIGAGKAIESGSRRPLSAISSEAPKPARQRGKPASEVLGHRLDDSKL